MQIIWEIDSDDIRKIQEFVDKKKNNQLVKEREKINLEGYRLEITKENVWKVLVGCLLTSQQRSGRNSKVASLLKTNPFPLSYNTCINAYNLEALGSKTLSDFGGIRWPNKIAKEIKANLSELEAGLWNDLLLKLEQLAITDSVELEREIADFIDHNLKGFGPKQSRNFLQWLGLTRYEIPIDSRVTKWLNKFGFPVVLSAGALGDKHYYQFVSDGIQQLCSACNIYPCILDAAIFDSFDDDT